MTFLAPVAGIVAGALALPVLLAMYFLRLRRRPVRVSSTLLWEQAVRDVQVNVPLRWLKPAWSLLLQMLALLCLVGAIARPGNPDDGPAGPVVILLDRSASMSALDGVPLPSEARATRFEEARRRALEAVDRLRGRGTRNPVLIAQFAATASALTPFTTDRATLREAILGLTPSDQPGDLVGALRLIETLAERAGDSVEGSDRPPATTLMVFSDGGFSPPEQPVVLRGLEIQLQRIGGHSGPETPKHNIGIVSLAALREHEDPTKVRLLARIISTAREPVEVPVRLSLNGADVELRTLSIPAARPDEQGKPAPGEATATFTFSSNERGIAVVALAGADLLAADDSAAVALPSPKRPRVLVVGGGGSASIDPFLLSALRVLDLSTLETVDPGAYVRLASTAAGPGQTALDNFDLIVFDRYQPRTVPPRATLSFASGLPIDGLSVSRDAADGPTGVLIWERNHPVLRSVPLDTLRIEQPARLIPPTATADLAVRVLAVGLDGPLMLALEQGSVRRLIVGFELARSTLGTSVALPILLSQAVDYLTLQGEASIGKAADTTRAVALRPDPQARPTAITLDGPLAISVPLRPGQDRVWVGPIERAGLYRVTGSVPDDALLAVNMSDEWESFVRLRDDLPVIGSSGSAAGRGPPPVRELWPWLLIAALVLLTAEWLIFARSMRT